MGKKRVIKKSGGEGEGTSRSASRAPKKKVDRGTLFINATYNNTMITVTNKGGDVIAWVSAGSLGFAGPKKATPFAASKAVAALVEKLKKVGLTEVEVVVKGVGSGRDSAIRSFATQGFNITSVKDVTPIPHNGPRPKKPRRI